jgi:prepilin signal peptidase PulO-like enzyme (type II secretory pathway)
MLELGCTLGLAALYQWEVVHAALFPEFAAHAILIWFMIVASMIDADEMTIPDAVSRPGTLVGLILAAFFPRSLLPDAFLHLVSPTDLPAFLGGGMSLAVGLACWLLWCLAILPRTWYFRHGWRRALQLCLARMKRETDSYRILVLALIGSVLIAGVWRFGGDRWQALLTALVGMAAGGGLIWAVRFIGAAVLRREAMGFGDVTLMAMIGAFLGWQACLIIFFLAPFAALAVGLVRLLFIRDRQIPYGPFLCLAALTVVLYWAPLWDWTSKYFQLGWIVPLVMLVCLAMMAVLLGLFRILFHR